MQYINVTLAPTYTTEGIGTGICQRDGCSYSEEPNLLRLFITSHDELNTVLHGLPENTVDLPYTLRVFVHKLGDSSEKTGSFGNALIANPNKYVNLDMSDSTFNTIGYMAFLECTGLIGIILPKSVTAIEGFAFYGCTGLAGIFIPDSVTSISDFAFHKCKSLTNITLPDKVSAIGVHTFSYSGLDSIIIPDCVTAIKNQAFSDCYDLTGITISDSVISIGNYAITNS
jgi:hypothetical protein